ncbi:isochorismatase family protein [Paludibacterium yongneupense]|uniref:isochorismatase family protein n=1 Tax=Paludibacterium yongneupense TaxID=400061 RepID=UPI00040CD13E|nr:isochorismatase family protein [Paludibacterium yongneupense]
MKISQRVRPALLGLVALSAVAVAAMPAAAAAPERTEKNAYLDMLSRDKAVLLLVDHQVGLISGVRDTTVGDLKHNVVALAKAARSLGVPVIVTATMPDGMWGPTMPELTAALPGVRVISRTVINAWEDPEVRSAIEKTGRKQIIIAGVSLEICAGFPALSAKAAGYDSRVVLDASGTFNEAKRTAGLQRLQGAGVPVTDYATAAVEMLRSNVDPKANEVYADLDMPFATLVWQIQSGFSKK